VTFDGFPVGSATTRSSAGGAEAAAGFHCFAAAGTRAGLDRWQLHCQAVLTDGFLEVLALGGVVDAAGHGHDAFLNVAAALARRGQEATGTGMTAADL